jgi:sugar/nucleoside kinase (ribokinase family)
MKKEIDATGIGNAIVDILTKVSDDFLKMHGLRKGSMTLIE